MFEIEDITGTEFDELLEHIDLSELDIQVTHKWTEHVEGAVGCCVGSRG